MRHWNIFAALLTCLLAPCLYAQEAPVVPVDVTVPGIPGVVAAGAKFKLLKEGLKSSEGTISAPDGTLYFTEPSENRIYTVDAKARVKLLLDAHKSDNPDG